MGELVGCLVCWLVDLAGCPFSSWFVGWLVGWFVWLLRCLVGLGWVGLRCIGFCCLVGRSVGSFVRLCALFVGRLSWWFGLMCLFVGWLVGWFVARACCFVSLSGLVGKCDLWL